MAVSILQYLSFKSNVVNKNAGLNLNHYEIKLLDIAAKFHFLNQTMFVGNLICQVNIASKETLHKALKKLIKKGLLSTEYQKDDGRIKKVELTKLALEHYKQLDKAVMHAQTSKIVQLKSSLK